MVIGVNEQLGPVRRAGRGNAIESWNDGGRFEQDRRHQHRERAIRDFTRESIGQRLHGVRGDFLHLDPLVRESIHLTTNRVELAVGGHETLSLAERQGRQPTRHKFVRVLPKRDVGGRVAEQPRESGTHACRLLEGAIPFGIDQLRRIEPRALLRLERDVRPGLVRMSREKDSFGDSEARIVRSERIRHSETTSNLPQVWKQRRADGRRQVRRAA